MSEPDPLELAAFLASTFERCGIRYILGGSLASTALGEPRATLDVDVAADLSNDTWRGWLTTLGTDFSSNIAGRVRHSALLPRPARRRPKRYLPAFVGPNVI